MVMLICIKQYLSSIHEKLKQAEANLKKDVAYKKELCI